MQPALINPARRKAKDRVARATFSGAQAAWLPLTVWFGVAILSVAVSHAQSAGTPEASAIEFAEPPGMGMILGPFLDVTHAQEVAEVF